jgi:putative iron-regulated protein
MPQLKIVAVFTAAVLIAGCSTTSSDNTNAPPLGFAQTYADIVHHSYRDSHESAVKLRLIIEAFLHEPTERTFDAAKDAWLAARKPYGQTEAYRFYEGPIDFADTNGNEGPEGRINAWPLNEAFIDYVKGNPAAGIINRSDGPITQDVLIAHNGAEDEANVTVGYHAIEFLLWGQDSATEGPGARPYTDYLPGEPDNERRREYLSLVVFMLVHDLGWLAESWAPGNPDNYRPEFIAMAPQVRLGKVMTGLATLSGFELASERIAVALDSGDQENEHSCFSDNTHNDIIYNAQGVWNVCMGEYGSVHGTGLLGLVTEADAALGAALAAQLKETSTLTSRLDAPFDQVLASPEGSDSRAIAEQLVTALQRQARLLVAAGKALRVEVIVAAE